MYVMKGASDSHVQGSRRGGRGPARQGWKRTKWALKALMLWDPGKSTNGGLYLLPLYLRVINEANKLLNTFFHLYECNSLEGQVHI